MFMTSTIRAQVSVFRALRTANKMFFRAAVLLFVLLVSSYGRAVSLSCDSTEECQTYIAGSVCDTGGASGATCQCPAGTILISDQTKCLEPATGYGNTCEDSSQCSEALSTGGSCVEGTCQCAAGYHYLKGQCWKNVGLAQQCYHSEQCYDSYEHIGFQCENTKASCECRPGYYQRSTYGCRKMLQSGQACYLSTDCWCSEEPGTCVNRVCECGGETNESNESKVQRLEKPVGVPFDGICPPGTYLSATGTCVLELGSDCTTDEECAEGVTNAKCVAGKCDCTNIFVGGPSNRECVKGAVGDVADIASASCLQNVSCSIFGSNSYCSDKKCACLQNTHWVTEEKLCWPTTPLAGSCSDEKDCNVKGGPFVSCQAGVCACNSGYHPVDGDTDCRADAHNEGDPCVENSDCNFSHGVCSTSKTCACEDHFLWENSMCRAGVGSPCTIPEDCGQMSNIECVGDGTGMTGMTCQCTQSFVSSENWASCLPVVKYDEACLETVQCNETLGDLRQCRDGLCQCREDAHYKLGLCFLTKGLGEQCAKRSECWTPDEVTNTMCQNGKCMCQYEYVRSEDGRCVSPDEAKSAGTAFYSQWVSVVVGAMLTWKISQSNR